MPKRSFPFEDQYLPQKKWYIGLENVNYGSKELMHQVYEKTQKKLFSGAKKLSCEKPLTPDNISFPKCCCNSGHETSKKCTFCEKPICSSCLQCCSKCNSDFCCTCSVLRYETQEVPVCLSCI